MRLRNLLSIPLLFVIFACRTRNGNAGAGPSSCSRELNGPIEGEEEIVSSVEDEDIDPKSPKGESIFLSGPVEVSKPFPLDFDEPPEDNEIMNAARTEMCEIGIPGFAEDAKKKLRKILQEDLKLKSPWQNNAWLIRFLRAKRYDVKETYKLIQKYYKFKADYYGRFFKGVIPSTLIPVFETNILLPLPIRDKKGRRILLFRAEKWDPAKIPLDKMFVIALLLAEAAAYEPKTQIAGIQIVIDWDGFSWAQTKQFLWGSKSVWAIIQWLQNSIPFKLKGLHIVNPGGTFSTMHGIFDRFMSPTIKERVHIHEKGTDLKVLYEKHDFDESNLPKKYGGTLSLNSAEAFEWETVLKHGDEEFKKMLSYGYKKK